MEVKSFADIEAEFMDRIRRVVWATVATVDTKGRPRTRILHPIWEGPIAYVATGGTRPRRSTWRSILTSR